MTTIAELKEWLAENGFTLSPSTGMHSKYNTADWYAWSRIDSAAPCEHNNHTIIEVWPTISTINGRHESAHLEIVGEANGAWWKLQAYGLSPDDVRDRYDSIANGLVTAWNALPHRKPRRGE